MKSSKYVHTYLMKVTENKFTVEEAIGYISAQSVFNIDFMCFIIWFSLNRGHRCLEGEKQ